MRYYALYEVVNCRRVFDCFWKPEHAFCLFLCAADLLLSTIFVPADLILVECQKPMTQISTTVNTYGLCRLFTNSRLLDLYGEDDHEFVVPLQDGEDEQESHQAPPVRKHEDKSAAMSEANSPQTFSASASKTDAHLPAKPGPTSNSSEQMSYSAQIARQFSAYHQTPSQERQQRSEIPLPANPNPHAVSSLGSSAIATHEGSAARANPDRPIRPSEMKDEG